MAKAQSKQLSSQDEGPGASVWGLIAVLVAALAFIAYQFGLNTPATTLDAQTPRVILQQGTLSGKVLQNQDLPVPVEAWLGVPYARPPTGHLRFARSKPVAVRKQRVDATKHGHRCPGKQLLKSDGLPEESEDCLTLNVFKQRDSGSKQPVMVYIHGGAFNRGYSSMHDTPSMVSWSQEPFIAVSFNYRLGALGFLPSSVAAKEGILNLGLRDQILVLEWVQRNIEAFGGNPDDVTIVGLSAGAHSAGHHIMNVNEDRQLFHKAVIESGGATSRAVHAPDSALHEAQYRGLLEKTGCQHQPEDRQIQCLRDVPSAKLVDAQADVFDEYNPSLQWAWQPSIDGDVISRRPIEALKIGKWHDIPILTGFNHNEGSYYVPKSLSNSRETLNFFKTMLPHLSEADLDRLNELYTPDTDPDSPYLDTRNLAALGISSQFKRVEAAYGHYAYVCPVRQTAQFGSAAQSHPIYLYHWALNSSVLNGANHADQMPFEAMSSKIRGRFDVHDRVSEEFHSYVTSFVLTGDPNKVPGLAPDRPKWAPFTAGSKDGDTMVFGSGNDEAAGGEAEGWASEFVVDTWAKKQCEFWWEMSERTAT